MNDRHLLLVQLFCAFLIGATIGVQPNSAGAKRSRANPALPSGSVTVPVVVSGSGVLPDGRSLVINGPMSVSIGEPPAPPKPEVLAIRDRMTMAVVNSANGRQILVLQGSSLGNGGRLVIGNFICAVSSWSDPEIVFVAPSPTAKLTAPFIVYKAVNNQWGELCRSAPFTLLPPEQPPAPSEKPIQFSRLIDKTGVERASFLVGEPIHILGKGFGSTPGRLFICGVPCPVSQWSDSEIVTTYGNANNQHRIWLSIRRDDGKSYATTSDRFPYVVAQ